MTKSDEPLSAPAARPAPASPIEPAATPSVVVNVPVVPSLIPVMLPTAAVAAVDVDPAPKRGPADDAAGGHWFGRRADRGVQRGRGRRSVPPSAPPRCRSSRSRTSPCRRPPRPWRPYRADRLAPAPIEGAWRAGRGEGGQGEPDAGKPVPASPMPSPVGLAGHSDAGDGHGREQAADTKAVGVVAQPTRRRPGARDPHEVRAVILDECRTCPGVDVDGREGRTRPEPYGVGRRSWLKEPTSKR